jgi:hypothetical protein
MGTLGNGFIRIAIAHSFQLFGNAHVGMVLITMRQYIECGDTFYDVLPHAGAPLYCRILDRNTELLCFSPSNNNEI